MKFLIFSLFFTSFVYAQTMELKSSSGTYQVRHTLKKVEGTSHELKGKISCAEIECELLVAAPIKSFVSSDSNRDLNMQQTAEASKYPYAMARGKFPKSDLEKSKWKFPAEVEFHGQKRKYDFDIIKNKENQFKASFVLLLDDHKIERPSLFGMKIENEVPMEFNLEWKK